MLRRLTRERREFVYRKSIEDREKAIASKKRSLKAAVDSNKLIPTSLQKEAIALHKTLDWDDEGGEGVTTHIDDEYQMAGVDDPRILITTSRNPSARLKQFAKEMKLIFPNSQRINRGNYKKTSLTEACIDQKITDLIMLKEHRGVPDGMVVCHLPHGPTAYYTLYNTVMRHDIPNLGTMSEQYPHLIFHNFTTQRGERAKSILKYLFPVPKEDSHRVITFANTDDYVSFRHHIYKSVDGKIELKEIGPRFEMFLYKIILGTLENEASADVEWQHARYLRTAKKRKFLSDD
jgi:U3 small nucleolar ribonucleoprotein protein IMP4